MEIITSIKSKADALVFAIDKACENGKPFDKGKVDEIFDYILSKVNLPDVETDPNAEYMNTLGSVLGRYANSLEEVSTEKSNL